MRLSDPRGEARDLLAALRQPATIRARCAAVTRSVAEGRSGYFQLDLGRLDDVARRVEGVIRRRFPDLRIPFHSRWRHFEAGGVDRKAELDAMMASRDVAACARARFDLTVVSVLLDAGAGPAWRYVEAGPGGASYARSEGLGVATFRAFLAGSFSAQSGDPLRCDAAALERLDASTLRAVFQSSPSNPLVGLDGRVGLMNRMGAALREQAGRDGLEARPGLLFDRLTARGGQTSVTATALLIELLQDLGPIWQSGSVVKGIAAGDVWPHRWAGADTGDGTSDATTGEWVPFHKLSQWLAYSLLEPLQWAGVTVTGLDALTGLPEYRNGGLLLDSGVIVPRHASDLARTWKPSDEFVVEWRALTVTLLDQLAERVRARLGVDADQMPLACILEGGTWAAGREIAAERREGGGPPFQIDSDGTVF